VVDLAQLLEPTLQCGISWIAVRAGDTIKIGVTFLPSLHFEGGTTHVTASVGAHHSAPSSLRPSLSSPPWLWLTSTKAGPACSSWASWCTAKSSTRAPGWACAAHSSRGRTTGACHIPPQPTPRTPDAPLVPPHTSHTSTRLPLTLPSPSPSPPPQTQRGPDPGDPALRPPLHHRAPRRHL
jgi:hypothetical protein